MGFFKKIGKIVNAPIKMVDRTLFGRKPENPANTAMPYLGQIEGVGRQYLQPYVNQGQTAYGKLDPLYTSMMQDPTAYLNKLMQGYEPSTGYQFQQEQMMKAMQNAAASGGFTGTEYDQMQRANTVRGLLGSDMQQYLDNVRGIQTEGMGGQQNFYNTGYGASNNLANYLGDVYSDMAKNTALGSYFQNEARNTRRNNRMKFLGSLVGAAAGGFNPNSLATMATGLGMPGFTGDDLSTLFGKAKSFMGMGGNPASAPTAPMPPMRSASRRNPIYPYNPNAFGVPDFSPVMQPQPRIPYR